MMYLTTPATLITTQNAHRFLLRAFVVYDFVLGSSRVSPRYSSFLDRQKYMQPGIGGTERRMYARLTQQRIVVLHACVA